jgi:hypothetical protein
MARSLISLGARAASTNARRGSPVALGLRRLEPTGQAAAPVHASAVPDFRCAARSFAIASSVRV